MSRLVRETVLVVGALTLAGCSAMGGMGNAGGAGSSTASQAELAGNAESVLRQQIAQPNAKRIPNKLLADARCVGVFPSVVKAGLIVGGQHGNGLVTCRKESGGFGSANPAVYSLTGGSIGLQAGAQKSSIVLLFETLQSVDALMQSNIKFGSQISATAGPTGYNHAIQKAPAPVVAYVMSQNGLYAGIDLSGTKLSFDQAANAGLYGDQATSEGVLLGRMPSAPAVSSFTQTVSRFAPTGQPNNSSSQSGGNGSATNSNDRQPGANQSGSSASKPSGQANKSGSQSGGTGSATNSSDRQPGTNQSGSNASKPSGANGSAAGSNNNNPGSGSGQPNSDSNQ